MQVIFRSRATAFQVLVRPEKKIYANDVEVDRIQPLTAEFAVHGPEFQWLEGEGADGAMHTNIRGHFFDSVQQAEEKGWTEEERGLVETVVLNVCKQQPGEVWLYSAPKVEPPWPTYDSTHHFKIPGLAEELGLLGAALVYEQQEKNREGVVKALEEKLSAAPPTPVEEKVEELVAQ